MNRAELKSKAKEQLRGCWGIAIITVLVGNLFINATSLTSGLEYIVEISDNLTLTLDLISIILGGVIILFKSKVTQQNVELLFYFYKFKIVN